MEGYDDLEGVEVMATNDRLDNHDERLNKHSDRLNQQGQRLTKLEEYDKDKNTRLKVIEENYKDLEKTIVSENREMRSFFLTNMDKQWDLIKSRDEQSHDTRRMRHDLDKTKVERWTDIIFKLVGTGGLLYLIVQAIL